MKLSWKIWTIVHRFFDIAIHFLFRIANFGRRDELPPISNLLLLSPASSLAAKIRKKKLKSVDLVKAYIARIKEVNPFINAAVCDRFDKALEEAQKVDEKIASNSVSEDAMARETPFLGVPFSVKELIAVEDMPFSAGLLSRKDVKSPISAQTVQLMRAAGAIPLATTNVSELGMWYESYNRVYGRTRNPYDAHRTCGGSSGGEGSLIGAAGSVIGIGSDIGGSIRIPAFFCGIFGHKPTPEMVSNYGTYPPSGEREFVPFLSMGPMCRYATDLIPFLSVLSGKAAPLLHLDVPVKINNLKIYYLEDVGNHIMFSKVDLEIIEALHKVLDHFSNAYKIAPRKLEFRSLRHMYFMWASAISSRKAPSFTDELTERNGKKIHFKLELFKWITGQSNYTFPAIVLGMLESSVIEQDDHYISLLKNFRMELLEILKDDCVLLFPSHPTVAPFHNEPVFKPFNFSYTAIFNVLGFPVTQCPLGLDKDGLPLGIQVVSCPLNDRVCLNVAVELEKAFGGWRSPSKIIE